MSLCSDDFEQSSVQNEDEDMDDFLPSEDEEPPSDEDEDDQPPEDNAASGGARSDCLLMEHDGKYYEVPLVADFDPQRSAAAATVAGVVRYYGETFETAGSLQKLADGDPQEWKNLGYTFEDDIARRVVVVKGADGRMSRYGWFFLLEHATQISTDSRILRPVPDSLFQKWWRALGRSNDLAESKLKDMRPCSKTSLINAVDSGFKLYAGRVVSKVKQAPPPPKPPAAEKKAAAPRKRKAGGESSQSAEKKDKKEKKSAEATTEVAEKRQSETLTKHFQRKAPVEDDGDEGCTAKPPEPPADGELVPLKSSKAIGKLPAKAPAKAPAKPTEASATDQKFSEIGTATFELRWSLDKNCKNLVFKIPDNLSPTMATGTIKLTLD